MTLTEAVATIGADGSAEACRSRLPRDVGQTLAQCIGLPLDRGFTGMRRFTRAIDWTLHYPASAGERTRR